MEPGEHQVMAEVEGRHWWYRGLRDAVRRTLRGLDPAPASGARILDAGCGTGENLRFLAEWLRPDYLGGFDLSPEALEIARGKATGADVYRGDIRDPEIRGTDLDLVLSLDVIYIPGVEACREGLSRLVAAMRPGGLIVVNLPAYRWLYSEHDVAIHTSERYTAGQVGTLLEDLGLAVERISYRLCLLFPLVVLSRIPGMIRARRSVDDLLARSDLHHVPGALVNRTLLAFVRAENRLIARGIRLPWGSSVFAVGRKP